VGGIEILFRRKEGETRLIKPEIKTKSVGAMSFLGATMIKKKKKRKKKKTSKPEGVRRGDDEKINVIFGSGVEDG